MSQLGLEAWLIGTPTELDTAVTALASAGRIAERGERHPLGGADRGRYRQYLRVAVPTSGPNSTAVETAAAAAFG